VGRSDWRGLKTLSLPRNQLKTGWSSSPLATLCVGAEMAEMFDAKIHERWEFYLTSKS
jgi:hypothetical protein